MDFKDQIRQLGERSTKLKEQIQTEEATKNALIMPFIQCLGYDVFNPFEVVPEYTTDVGTKKGEKVDYALIKDKQPIIIIECKNINENLELHDNQLIRYFHVSKAKFAILTNGLVYKFFTDLDEPNKMDSKPFLEFNITEIKDTQVEELKKFHKSYFDVQNIISSASDLKFTNQIKTIISNELKSPSEQFIKYFTGQVYTGRLTDKVIFQFSELVRKSVNQVIGDMISERLKNALKENDLVQQNEPVSQAETEVEEEKTAPKIETTSEELEGYYLVKSILRKNIDSNRISFKDAQSYFVILLDDNNRKTICRLYFNGKKKYIGIFDASKKEVKNEIYAIDDIYNYSNELNLTLNTYISINS
jgi:hypothetical protein